jgi:UDP-galactopyranose mutase
VSRRKKTCAIIGAGITGASAAWKLYQLGWQPVVYEANDVPGGQLRAEKHGNAWIEPHGPHILHTGSPDAIQVLRLFGDLNGYQHRVKTSAPDGTLLSWPLQLGELKQLTEWPRIQRELDARPAMPHGADFETWAISLMGETLYRWFCYDYTKKQWGCEPKLLSSHFAPRRLHLRDDGDTRMFREPVQGWNKGGWHRLVDNLLAASRAEIHTGQRVTAANLPAADAYIITSPLDEFLGKPDLPWRGVHTVFQFFPDKPRGVLSAPVVNEPSAKNPWTREVETTQMALDGEPQVLGTAVGRELPGDQTAKHYPLEDAAGENRARHRELADIIHRELPTAQLAGRLASYAYIDIDQAILQGAHAAQRVFKEEQHER